MTEQVSIEGRSKENSPAAYLLLYIPFVLSLMFSSTPVGSYFVAWVGSFFIFWLSFTNKIKSTHKGVSIPEKLLRPIFLTQIIFAGYMSCTSIFYFMDLLGYEYFTKVPYKITDAYEVSLAAACQRCYCLGHAALVTGMLVFYKSDIRSPYKIVLNNWPLFFIKFGIMAAIVGFGFSKVGSLSVLAGAVQGIAFVASTIGLALSIPLKKRGLMLFALTIFGLNMVRALTSGFKEPVIVSFLMLGIFLFPFYKKLILTTFIPLMLLLFTVLPTYVNTFRAQTSNNSADAETAKAEALNKVREQLSGNGLAETNWDFLTGRISEIGMFTTYKENTDVGGKFYGFNIINQSLVNLVPRVFWSSKPNIEALVLVRVLENGVIADYASETVSAKPAYVVDAYLSFGSFGVWVFLFLYGAFAQLIANKSEQLFGGYFFGVAFVFTGIMNCLWRGNCFEFIFNNIMYGYFLIIALSFILRRLGIVVPNKERPAAHPVESSQTPELIVTYS